MEGDGGNSKINICTRSSKEEADTFWNRRYYRMDHIHRGQAVIFNHETFKYPGLKERIGTHFDCERLEKALRGLRFEVHVYNNQNYGDIDNILSEMASRDYTDCDCFVLVVLTHGDPGKLYANDKEYEPQELWHKFTDINVPSLQGKPKLFFIQACRGKQLDKGIEIIRSRTETDNKPDYYTVPTHPDLLIAYSAPPGYYAWRNVDNGSWFIQTLCHQLETNGLTEDLLTLITFVCQDVAFDYESYNPWKPDIHGKKGIPWINYTLTALVKFTNRP